MRLSSTHLFRHTTACCRQLSSHSPVRRKRCSSFRISSEQNRATTVMDFINIQHPRKIRQDKGPMTFHINLLMSPEKTLVKIAQRHRQAMIFEHPLLNQSIGHAIANESIGNRVSYLIGIATSWRNAGNWGLKIQRTLASGLVDTDLGNNPTAAIEHGQLLRPPPPGPQRLASGKQC